MRSAALGCAFLAFSLLIGCSGKTALEPISVGHLAPLGGPNGVVGKRAQQAIQLAVEEANRDENRIAGRQVAVRHVDTSGDARTAQQEAVRLLTVNKVVALLGNLEAGQAESVGLQVQSYKVPVVVTAGLAAPPTSKYLFATGPPPAARGQALARLAAEKLQKAPIALLVPDRGTEPAAVADAFTARLGAERARRWTYPAEPDSAADPKGSEDRATQARKREADLDDVAKKVATSGPQAVLLVGSAADCLRLRSALEKAGLSHTVPVLFGGAEQELTAIEASGQAGDGVYAATAFWLDAHTPRAREIAKSLARAEAFATTYQARYGEPPDANAALAYDSAGLLFEAMRRAKSFDGDKVQEQLAALQPEFEGLTGPLSRRPTFIVQMKGGRPQLVEFYPPP
jgi:branched-chain amino acid transport system substrate-binding protein